MKRILKKVFVDTDEKGKSKLKTSSLLAGFILSIIAILSFCGKAIIKVSDVSCLPAKVSAVENRIGIVEDKFDTLSFKVCNNEKTVSKLDSLPNQVATMQGQLSVIITMLGKQK